jgi:protein TonB
MPSYLLKFNLEQAAGLLFVLVLHGALLYGLWSYRIIPTPDEAIVLMVNLINPPPPEQPRPPKPQPPRPQSPKPVEPPPPQQLVAETPVIQPGEPVVYEPPPPPPPPPPVIEAPPLPPQQVVLSSELAVSCPERSPPDYPRLSMHMNEQGKVVLRVELGEDGRIARAVVKASSGYSRLDEAALNTVKMWRCNPPVRNGAPARAVALQPFNFILEGK